MWSSLKNIVIPESPEEAYTLFEIGKKVYFSGGTYLVAKKDPAVNTLIDINHIIDNRIIINKSTVRIGAGTTLQKIIETPRGLEKSKIPLCAKWSCSSKNIRNQRTIGGEVAYRRTNSELYSCLYALNVSLEVVTTGTHTVPIREWDGSGVIRAIEINTGDLRAAAVQRFALIPSAPAFVIIVAVQKEQSLEIAVSGHSTELSFDSIPVKEFTDDYIGQFSEMAGQSFQSDQYGSVTYKQTLIQVGLKRIRNEL